jgi:hypothetical protein
VAVLLGFVACFDLPDNQRAAWARAPVIIAETGDERFVAEKRSAKGWAMSPCFGHGFKFGVVMGLELVRTIVAGRDPTHASWAAGLEGDKPT